MEGIGEAAAQDFVEDGAGAAVGMRPNDLHPGFDPGRGVLLGANFFELDPRGSLVEEGDIKKMNTYHFRSLLILIVSVLLLIHAQKQTSQRKVA